MTVHFSITPGIDNRINAWNNFTSAKYNAKGKAGPCITISREFGCQAYPVADLLYARLSEKAGKDVRWAVLDRILLERIAEESGFSKSDIDHVADHNPIFHEMVSMFMGKHRAEQFEVFTYIRKAVLHFAKAGNSIIVGRGAASFTQDLPNCIHIRLVAPIEFRIQNIMQGKNLDKKEAIEHIKENQERRDNFVQHFTDRHPNDPSLYHAVINNARYTPEEIVRIIECHLDIFNSA